VSIGQVLSCCKNWNGLCRVTQPQQLINVLIRSLILIASRKVSFSSPCEIEERNICIKELCKAFVFYEVATM